MVSCCVPGCHNYSKKAKKNGNTVTYQRITQDHHSKVWLDRIRWKNIGFSDECKKKRKKIAHIHATFSLTLVPWLKNNIMRHFLSFSFQVCHATKRAKMTKFGFVTFNLEIENNHSQSNFALGSRRIICYKEEDTVYLHLSQWTLNLQFALVTLWKWLLQS